MATVAEDTDGGSLGPDSTLGPGSNSRVRRLPERARYDRATIHAILDEGFVCHLGFVDDGRPVVVPTAYARVGDSLYLHGASGNHALRRLAAGTPACVTVTLVDGLVLARAAFHHSINYRSVMVFGTARAVDSPAEKTEALLAVVEHIVPGRSADARGPNESELRTTRVVRFDIAEGSAKVRTGGPKDDDEDLALPIWAGQLPLLTDTGIPVPDDLLPGDVPAPDYLTDYRRPGGVTGGGAPGSGSGGSGSSGSGGSGSKVT